MWIGNLPCSRHCTDGFISSESDKVGHKGPRRKLRSRHIERVQNGSICYLGAMD